MRTVIASGKGSGGEKARVITRPGERVAVRASGGPASGASAVTNTCARGMYILGYLEKGIQTPIAQGRSA